MIIKGVLYGIAIAFDDVVFLGVCDMGRVFDVDG